MLKTTLTASLTRIRRWRTLSLFLIVFIAPLLGTPNSMAQTETPPVTAEISISKARVYERESFLLTLTIKTTGVQIRQKLDLNGLPDRNRVDIFTPFEALPSQRVGDGHRITKIHRYQCSARALATGTILIAPNLQLIAMRRRRMLIGSAWEEFPLNVTIAPLHLAVKPLPPAPADFSGAIGSFTFKATIAPTNIVNGDLVTLTTRITGRGYRDDIREPKLSGSQQFKVYDSKHVHTAPDLLIFEQVVIPQSTTISAIPKIALTYFDPESRSYKRADAGPFPIAFHVAAQETLEHFRPSDEDAGASPDATNAPTTDNLQSRFRRYLGHARYEQTTCLSTTKAYMAPSISSHSHFEIAPGEEMDILQKHNGWMLIESDNKRGWIPNAATADMIQ